MSQQNLNDPDLPSTKPSLASLQLNRRHLLILLALGVLTIGLLIVLSGGQNAMTTLNQADWRLFLLAVLIHYSSFAMRGYRWQQLLGLMGHRLSYFYVTGLLLSGWFISAIVPARAGDAARVAILYSPLQRRNQRIHASIPIADSLGSIVLERVLDILTILVLGAGFGYLVVRMQLPRWVLTAYLIGLSLLALFGLILLIPKVVEWLQHLSSHTLWLKILDFAKQLLVNLRILFRYPFSALLLLAESAYIWLCDALVLWLIVWGLGQQAPFNALAFVAFTNNVFAAVPLTPGGVGQIETVFAALLRLLSLPEFNIPLAVLLIRFISYWSFLVFSGVITFAFGIGQLLMGTLSTPQKQENHIDTSI